MIFGNSNELADFVDGLLKADNRKDVLQILQSEDQKQLTYAKNNMIHKMPKELQPNRNLRASPLKDGHSISSFPTMFEATDKKTYEYINENIDNMRKIANNYSQVPKNITRHSSRQAIDSVIQRKDIPQKEPLNLVEPQILKDGQMIQKMQKQNGSVHSSQSIHSSLNKSQKSPINNPFVANRINFTDKFANSKVLQQKYHHLSYSENSRNLTAMAQTAKYNAFSQSVAFPTTVLGGTMLPPKDKTFSKDTKLNVDDIMRYTLGVKRQKMNNTPTQNPFVRAPKRRE